MHEETIKVFAMRCENGRAFKGRIEEMSNTLKAEQEFVGGYISAISLTDEIDIIVNEEGKLQDLPINRAWVDDKGKILDLIVGNVCACRHDDNGNFTSILDSDIPVIIKHLPAIMVILDTTVFLRVEEDLFDYEEI